jgi:hypothetical protein
MGTHPTIETSDAGDPGSRQIFVEVAERIQRSLCQGATNAPMEIAALVADAVERTSGERIRDQARLARQMLLWHHDCPPERARTLTVAALADRVGALRRSVARRRLQGGSGK